MRKREYNQAINALAKTLRNNMTPQERRLWHEFLKDLPVDVHRQKVFDRYIVDFYIASSKMVIELDGSQHYEKAGKEKDALRDAYFQSRGFTVLRYPNSDINTRFAAVCEDILNHMRKPAESKRAFPYEGKVARRSRDG